MLVNWLKMHVRWPFLNIDRSTLSNTANFPDVAISSSTVVSFASGSAKSNKYGWRQALRNCMTRFLKQERPMLHCQIYKRYRWLAGLHGDGTYRSMRCLPALALGSFESLASVSLMRDSTSFIRKPLYQKICEDERGQRICKKK